MASKVTALIPKQAKITLETAKQVYELLGQFTDAEIPAYARERIRNEIYRVAEPEHATENPFGVFVMISVAQTAAIWDAIRKTKGIRHREQVRHAFDIVLTNLRMDTGEVMLTRDEIAGRMECSADDVSNAMGELAKLGIVEKVRRPVPGMSGPGIVAYFINPNYAWNGNMSLRQERAAQFAQRSFKLITGGAERERPNDKKRARALMPCLMPA